MSKIDVQVVSVTLLSCYSAIIVGICDVDAVQVRPQEWTRVLILLLAVLLEMYFQSAVVIEVYKD